MKVMNEKEYRDWLKNRPEDPAEWKNEDCRAADAFVKLTALANYGKKVDSWEIPPCVKKFLKDSALYTYATVETDMMLQELGCYPEE